MAKRPLPTPEQLRQLLDYNPANGAMSWRERPLSMFSAPTPEGQARACKIWNSHYAGMPAGTFDRHGYLLVKIFDRPTLGHRIAWAIVHGEWPETIDHINGDPSDNRLKNLRNVSRKINQRNQKRHKSNTSGRTGVSWAAGRCVWVAQIKINDETEYLGSFYDFNDAVAARKEAERKYGFTGRQ